MKRLPRPLLLLLGLCVVACAPRERTLVLLSTNDVHAAIENFPRLATAVERCRDTADVILVDAGDRWTGNAYVDHAPEPGMPVIELMNELGYDAATFGNHEFDHGLEVLANRTSRARFAVVCANLQSDTSIFPQPDPYVIVRRGGLRVGFVGLVTNFVNGHPDGKAESYRGLRFPSPFEAGKAWQKLADRVDVLVALTHIGDGMDRVLATDAPAYDLIVGGHTHTVIDPGYDTNGVLLTQTGKSLQYVGATVLRFRGRELLEISNRLYPLSAYPEDAKFARRIAAYYDNPELREPVGSTSGTMDKTGLANLMGEAMIEATGADLALYHFGGIRMEELPAGEVTLGDLYTLEPFSSTVYVAELTVDDLQDMILTKFNDTANAKESHRIDLLPTGFRYTVRSDASGDARDVQIEGLEKGRVYTVAMGDYIFKHYAFNKLRGHRTEEALVTDVMRDYLGRHSPVAPDNAPRGEIR